MPCYEPLPTPEDLITLEKQKNLQEHKLYCTNNELIAMLINIACEMGNLIQYNYGHTGLLSTTADKWYQRHKEHDRMITDKKLFELRQKRITNKTEAIIIEEKIRKLENQ
jgi:hypothetical protein